MIYILLKAIIEFLVYSFVLFCVFIVSFTILSSKKPRLNNFENITNKKDELEDDQYINSLIHINNFDEKSPINLVKDNKYLDKF